MEFLQCLCTNVPEAAFWAAAVIIETLQHLVVGSAPLIAVFDSSCHSWRCGAQPHLLTADQDIDNYIPLTQPCIPVVSILPFDNWPFWSTHSLAVAAMHLYPLYNKCFPLQNVRVPLECVVVFEGILLCRNFTRVYWELFFEGVQVAI